MNHLLEVKNLQVSFFTYAGEVQAVRDVASPSPRVRRLLSLENRVQENP